MVDKRFRPIKDLTAGGIILLRDSAPNDPFELVTPVAGKQNKTIAIIYICKIYNLLIICNFYLAAGPKKEDEEEEEEPEPPAPFEYNEAADD